VRAMPLDAQDGFFDLTTVSLAIAALLTWLGARALMRDAWRALVAIPLLFGTWVVAPNLREFGLIDPLAWAFMAGVWLATIHQRWWVAAGVAALGVVAKEVVVLAALAAAAAAWDRQRVWRAPAVAAPAVLVAVLLTILVPGSGTDAPAYLGDWVRKGLFSNGVGRAAFLLFASYGALWLLLPLAWKRAGWPDHVRRDALVFLLAVPVLPLVGSPERMEEAVFPAVITAAVLATRNWSLPLVWALALGNLLFVARVGGSAGGDSRVATGLAWAGLAVACALALWGFTRSRFPLLRPARSPT
jgi:hypothetical protein